jgi:hypothetical protein
MYTVISSCVTSTSISNKMYDLKWMYISCYVKIIGSMKNLSAFNCMKIGFCIAHVHTRIKFSHSMSEFKLN